MQSSKHSQLLPGKNPQFRQKTLNMQSYIKPQITQLTHARMTNYDRGTRVITLLQLLSGQFGDSATILRKP